MTREVADANSPALRRTVASAVTALFVPGDRPDRFTKAAATGADLVIIDLEDAVAPAAKTEALAAALRALERRGGTVTNALVRINPLGSGTHELEVRELLGMASSVPHHLLGLMVPKAEYSKSMRALISDCRRADLAVVPLIETAVGMLDARDIATIPGVSRLAFGAIDFALDIDAGSSERPLDYARSVLVVASKAAGIAPPLDSPATTIRDMHAVSEEALLSRGFGFGGKLCIHPAQVPTVAGAFVPTDEDMTWAESVLSVGAGASQLHGQMIDRPVIERARRIIARARKD